MAAQPIYPNEFNEGMNILYKDITRYLDARFEAINRQNMAERSETQKRFENMEQRLTNIERDVSNVVAFQQTLMETFKGFATDIIKRLDGMQEEMREGFRRPSRTTQRTHSACR